VKAFAVLCIVVVILCFVIVNKAKKNPEFCTDYASNFINCKMTNGKMSDADKW
jgi:hypothetical protein